MSYNITSQVIAVLIFMFLGFLVGVAITPAEKECKPFEVRRVIDGDTIRTESGKDLRLARIDAPELAGKIEPAEAGAQEAKDYLQYLSFVQTCYEYQDTGKYGRTIVEIKANVSDLMIESGNAEYYRAE